MLLSFTEKYEFCLQFPDFDIFLSTNFVENMNSILPSNRILPYFEEVLVNALSLQIMGIFEWLF